MYMKVYTCMHLCVNVRSHMCAFNEMNMYKYEADGSGYCHPYIEGWARVPFFTQAELASEHFLTDECN